MNKCIDCKYYWCLDESHGSCTFNSTSNISHNSIINPDSVACRDFREKEKPAGLGDF